MASDPIGTPDDFESYMELQRLFERDRAKVSETLNRIAAGDGDAMIEHLMFDHQGMAELEKRVRDATGRALGR